MRASLVILKALKIGLLSMEVVNVSVGHPTLASTVKKVSCYICFRFK